MLHDSCLTCRIPALKYLVILLSVALLCLAVMSLRAFIVSPGQSSSLVLAIAAAVSALGLFHLKNWARKITVAALWMVILGMIGRLGPFTAGDYLTAGRDLPSVGYLTATAALVIIPALTAIHILGKYRGAFSLPRDNRGSGVD